MVFFLNLSKQKKLFYNGIIAFQCAVAAQKGKVMKKILLSSFLLLAVVFLYGNESIAVSEGSYGKSCTYTKTQNSGNGTEAAINLPLPDGSKWTLKNALIKNDGSVEYHNSHANFKMTYGSYPLIASDVQFDGNTVKILKGKIQVKGKGFLTSKNKSFNELEVENLEFNYSECISAGKVKNCYGLHYVFNGWNFYYRNAVLTDAGISGEGAIYNYDEKSETLVISYFKNFLVKSNGTVESGISYKPSEQSEDDMDYPDDEEFYDDDEDFDDDESETEMIYEMLWEEAEGNYFVRNNFMMFLNDAEFVSDAKNGYILNSSSVSMEIYTNAYLEMVFGNTKIKSDATIISSEPCNDELEFESANGYTIKSTSAILDNSGVKIKGELAIEELNSSTVFDDYVIKINPMYVVTAESPDVVTHYKYSGWDITGTGAKYEYNTVTFNENTVQFRNAVIPLGQLTYNYEFDLIGEVENDQELNVNVVSENSEIHYSRFSRKGLCVYMIIPLPAPFEGNNLDFDEVYLEGDGNLYVEDSIHRYFTVGKAEIEMEDVILDKEGISAGTVNVSIPEADDFSISLWYVEISPSGIEVTDRAHNWNSLFGLSFFPKDVLFTEKGIEFSGSVLLPEPIPGVGTELDMERFCIDFDGTVHDVVVEEPEDSSVQWYDIWDLKVN